MVFKMNAIVCTCNYFLKEACFYELLDLGPCVNSTCSATWPPPRERLQRLLDTSFPVLPHQRDVISAMGAQVPPADLIFLAVTSENHFEEMQGMISDLHQVVFPWLKENTNYSYRLIVYDLGLQNTSAKSVGHTIVCLSLSRSLTLCLLVSVIICVHLLFFPPLLPY